MPQFEVKIKGSVIIDANDEDEAREMIEDGEVDLNEMYIEEEIDVSPFKRKEIEEDEEVDDG